MILIIEIILTVFVWRKGWKWLALLPVGIAMLIAFIAGYMVGLSGGNVSEVSNNAILLDILAIITLIIMLIKAPKNNKSLNNSTDVKTQA